MVDHPTVQLCKCDSKMSLIVLQSLATWESENKINCKQTLVDGDGPKTYWTRELNGDELILVSMEFKEKKTPALNSNSKKLS